MKIAHIQEGINKEFVEDPNRWLDNDFLMELAIINLLANFFEEELTPEEFELNKERWQELKELYEYFLPFKSGNNIPCEIMHREERKLFDKNILRVVELRGLLWT